MNQFTCALESIQKGADLLLAVDGNSEIRDGLVESKQVFSMLIKDHGSIKKLYDQCYDAAEINRNLDFLFHFYQLGYEHAISTLKRMRTVSMDSKIESMREFFNKTAEKEGL